MTETIRCSWSEGNDLLRAYHDAEWGVPVHDDLRMFEYLFLESMQCGLNWNMMLAKREIFRQCFDNFDFEKIAQYDEDRVQQILETPGMIRSRSKVLAEINNARCTLELIRTCGSLCGYLWQYSKGCSLVYRSHRSAMPAQNALSEAAARDMKKRGFKYLGPVTLYSHLQSCGIINDHAVNCFRYAELTQSVPTEYLDE